MRIVTYVFCVVLILTTPPASAGAWMREPGTAFSSLSFSIDPNRTSALAAYLEYGKSKNLTFGADLNATADAGGLKTGQVTFFIRRPLGRPDAKYRLAYELGLGGKWEETEQALHLKAGLSWGRGIQIGQKYGWASVEASHILSLGDSADVSKFDATVGLNYTDRYTGMMQLFLSHSDGETSSSIAPSVIVKGKGRFKYQIGFETPLGSDSRTSLKLGLWREF
jgi:hypothetical protein